MSVVSFDATLVLVVFSTSDVDKVTNGYFHGVL